MMDEEVMDYAAENALQLAITARREGAAFTSSVYMDSQALFVLFAP